MKKYRYNYFVKPLEDASGEAYEVIIPKFSTIHVFADTIEELHENVMQSIHLEIKRRKRQKLPIPKEDIGTKCNGKILLRIKPMLHEKLISLAQVHQMSLNKYIEKKLFEA